MKEVRDVYIDRAGNVRKKLNGHKKDKYVKGNLKDWYSEKKFATF